MSGPPPGAGAGRAMSVGNGPPSAGLGPHPPMGQPPPAVPPPAGGPPGPQSQQNLNQIVSMETELNFTSPCPAVVVCFPRSRAPVCPLWRRAPFVIYTWTSRIRLHQLLSVPECPPWRNLGITSIFPTLGGLHRPRPNVDMADPRIVPPALLRALPHHLPVALLLTL